MAKNRRYKRASKNAPEVGLGDDEGSFFVAADNHHRLQLHTACTL
jgi:hypothetical protein